jgi:hypothetical protein
MASTECLHELNAFGGFQGTHGRFCGYGDCDDDATTHIRVIDRGWCGNVCGKCKDRIARTHRVAVETKLRGLNSEEDHDNPSSN